MALRKNGNQPPTLDQLRSQHSELTSRAGAVAGQLARLDPVNDWELASRALAEQAALERAVVALELRIEAAQIAERAAGAEAQDAERAARAVAAQARLDAAAKAYLDALAGLPAAELAAAQLELGAVGGWASSPALLAIHAARDVDGVFQRLRFVAPTWCGLPEPEPAAVVAVKEARAAVKRAEQRLDDLRAMKRQVKHGAAQPDDSMLVQAAGAVLACRRRLLFLTDGVALDSDDGMQRCLGGLQNELSGWLEGVYEARRRAEFQAQQQAQQSLVMA
jgi:hypothetical protein